MKKGALFFFLFIFFPRVSFAQPDLICSNITIMTPNVHIGGALEITYRIKNIGNVPATPTHCAVYLNSSNGPVQLSQVSTQQLLPNQETRDTYYTYTIPYKSQIKYRTGLSGDPNPIDSVKIGLNYVSVYANVRGEIVESNNNNNQLNQLGVSILANPQYLQHLPYPIIFVHGLNADNSTWQNLIDTLPRDFGYSYGGNMNFCLNQDANIYSAKNDYHDWTNETSMNVGDFYTVNFSVDTDGKSASSQILQPNAIESNQAAIVKQGWAIRDAIKHVLKITGRDKVILVGHSMGGLANREYLQNSNNWQLDGMHHVAKYLSIGTPHGGSNITGFVVGSVIGYLWSGFDEQSEAVRDLRTKYDVSGLPGVYLFGGRESYSVMKNSLIWDYNNVDVNCNGINADQSQIVGLNYKKFPLDLKYSCVIGTGNILSLFSGSGDGIVDATSQNLNKYSYSTNVNADTFVCIQPMGNFKIWHLEEPKQIYQIIQGLDEPSNSLIAYNVKLGNQYFGNFTLQSQSYQYYYYSDDSDTYKFSIPQNGSLHFTYKNIPTNSSANFFNSNASKIIPTINTNYRGSIDTTFPINTGTYNMTLWGLADNLSYLNPYSFKLDFVTSTKPLLSPNPLDTLICSSSPLILSAPSGFAKYKWNTNDSTRTLSVTKAGSYYCSVLDTSGYWSLNSDTVNVRLDSLPTLPLTISQNVVSNICMSTQQRTLNSTSGYYYQWYKNDTLINNATSKSYIPPLSGFYKVQVYSKNKACSFISDSLSVTISNNVTRIFTSDTIKTCGVNYIPLDAGAGYSSYLWSTGETTQTINAYQTGLYKITAYCGTTSINNIFEQFSSSNNAIKYITIQDASQLHFTNQMSLLFKTRIEGSYANSNTLIEKGSNAGYQIKLDGLSSSLIFWYPNIDNTVGLKYTLTTSQVQNSDWFYVGVVKRSDTSIFDVNGNLVDKAKTVNPLPINNSNITIGAGNGGVTEKYSGSMDNISFWNRSLTQAEVSQYAECMTGKENSCVAYYNFENNSNYTLAIDNSVYGNNAIQNGSINSYPSNQIITCTPTAIKDSIFIRVINPTILQNDTAVCPNTTLSLTLQNTQINKTVKWSTGDTTSIIKVKPIINTTYWVSVSDGYETCTDSIKVGVTTLDTSLGYVGKPSMCIGDSIIFFGGLSASSYQWLKNNSPITGATTQKLIIKTSGNYRVLVTNINGCSDTSRSIAVTVNSLPAAPIITSVGATTICSGDSVTLNSNASSANQWFLNGNVIVGANSSTYTATSSGYYTVIASNANGCYSMVSNIDTVTVNLLPSGNIQPIAQNYICDGNTIILKTGGNYKFQWQNNNTPIIGATDSNYTAFIGGNYSVQYRTAFGCTSISTNSLNLTLIKKPIIDFSFTARCINQPILFQNLSDSSKSGAVNWLWSLGNGVTSTLSNPTVTYSNANTYLISLIGTNISCSSLSDSVSKQLVLEQNPAPITYPVIDAKIQSPIQLQARNIGTSFNWNPSTGLSNPNISNPLATLNNQQLYKVVITDNAGCNVVDTQLVRIFNGYDVFVPSGFSPDGDHVNDILRPILIGIKNINYFKVFNRWGQLIFETNQMNNGWDGTYLSKPQPSETYIWMIEAVDLNDKIIDKSGKSTLIR